jgi:hypothetical protein
MSLSSTLTVAAEKTLSSLCSSDNHTPKQILENMYLSDVKSFVVWLENRKIRSLTFSERSTLLSNLNWEVAISEYLMSLHCPYIWGQDSIDDCLLWLVDYAMNLEYEENGENL